MEFLLIGTGPLQFRLEFPPKPHSTPRRFQTGGSNFLCLGAPFRLWLITLISDLGAAKQRRHDACLP